MQFTVLPIQSYCLQYYVQMLWSGLRDSDLLRALLWDPAKPANQITDLDPDLWN